MVNLEGRRRGTVIARLLTQIDTRNAGELRQLLLDAVRRDGQNESEVGAYEMTIDRSDGARTTFVLPSS